MNYNLQLNKYLAFNFVSELFPANIFRRRQKVFKGFGVGLTTTYNSIETLMDVEEDFSEYEYENL